jgi:hypothetical protein
LSGCKAHERHASTKPRAVFPQKQSRETVKADDQSAHADQPLTAKIVWLQGARKARKHKAARGAPPKNSLVKQSKLTIKAHTPINR